MRENYFFQVEREIYQAFAERSQAEGYPSPAKRIEAFILECLGKPQPKPAPTRVSRKAVSAILFALRKAEGGLMTLRELAFATARSYQHTVNVIGDMALEGLVISERVMPSEGRPTKLWELTEAGNALADYEFEVLEAQQKKAQEQLASIRARGVK
jgi:DNA-binding MarR family transcriptional regulator